MEKPRLPGASFPAPRRVFTAPVSSSSSQLAFPPQSGDGLVETLYNHPSAKIIAFAAGSASRPLDVERGRAPAVDVEPGSLSWSSRFERTIAVGTGKPLISTIADANIADRFLFAGAFRIYRAPGSVAFLNCGSALQPILPKSQCWCVDEASSKYVLQIRRPQYWRIEIPVAEPEDIERAKLLRQVLDSILQFEKTECPFNRSFTVDLPEPPLTPVKKRPWTPVRRSFVSLPPSPVTPIEEYSAIKRRLAEETSVKHEKQVESGSKDSSLGTSEAPPNESSEARLSDSDVPLAPAEEQPWESEALLEVKTTQKPSQESPSVEVLADSFEQLAVKNPTYPKSTSVQVNRCVTAPPHLTIFTSHLSKPSSLATEVEVEAASAPSETTYSETQSPTPSQESFHSVQSWHSPITPLPPSPPLSDPGSPLSFPYPHEDIVRSSKPVHQRDTSDSTETPRTVQAWTTFPSASAGDGDGSPSAGPTAPPSVAAAAEETEIFSEEAAETAAEDLVERSQAASEAEDEAVPTGEASSSSFSTISPRPQIRHRPTASSSISPSRRALSPLPPAANLFTPRQPVSLSLTASARNKLSAVRRLPMAVIQKTCEILLSPPSHLINLMLKVAARISAGEWRGFVFGMSDSGEKIPVRWDWSDEDDDGYGELDGWGADDDWPHSGVARKMAGSFPEEDDSASEGGISKESDGGEEAPKPPTRELSDAEWSRSWGVD